MTLSRYERMIVPEDIIRDDLMKTPYAKELKFDEDKVEVLLSRIPYHEIFPSCFGDIEDYIHKERAKLGLFKVEDDWFQQGCASYNSGIVYKDQYWRIPLRQYCSLNNLSFQIVRDEHEIPILMPKGKRIGCYVGLHKYEDEPEIKEYVRSTGVHFFFFSSGVQHGIKRCRHCGHRQHVERSGLVGSGSGTKWVKCSAERGKEIDALPRL